MRRISIAFPPDATEIQWNPPRFQAIPTASSKQRAALPCHFSGLLMFSNSSSCRGHVAPGWNLGLDYYGLSVDETIVDKPLFTITIFMEPWIYLKPCGTLWETSMAGWKTHRFVGKARLEIIH